MKLFVIESTRHVIPIVNDLLETSFPFITETVRILNMYVMFATSRRKMDKLGVIGFVCASNICDRAYAR